MLWGKSKAYTHVARLWIGGSQGGGYENTFFCCETSYNLVDMYCVVKEPAAYFTLAEQSTSVNGCQGIRHHIPDDNLLITYLLYGVESLRS
jgi:hypothetical protein